jgi:hypothetical protein
VFSELEALEVVEMMATDESEYRLWTTAFRKTIWLATIVFYMCMLF